MLTELLLPRNESLEVSPLNQPPNSTVMTNKAPILLLLSAAFLLASEATAQCRKFSKQRVISALSPDLAIDQITTGTLGRGESAAALIEVESTGEIDLVISTHPELGEVTFNVMSTQGGALASGMTHGQATRVPISVEADDDLIVHIKSEMPVGTYVPLGCVSVATTTIITNEMDILTKE